MTVIDLPEYVADEEDVSRIICDKKFRKIVKAEDGSEQIILTPTAFMDSRDELSTSVNRISTLSIEERHNLGQDFQQKNQPNRTYLGYGEINVKICRNAKADVIKDDVGGTQPYHANLTFPTPQSKQGDFAIATEISEYAIFIKAP